MATPKFVQVKKTTLQSGITATEASEIVLKRLVDIYGNALAMSDFGSTLFLTLNPGGDNEEIISGTDFTVNSDGTVALDTGITRGLAAKSDYGSGGTARAHAAGTAVVVSNNPQLYNAIIEYVVDNENDQTIAGVKTFSSVPQTTGGDAVADNELVRKAQLDDAVIGVAGTVSTIVPGTAGEAVSEGDLVYFDTTDDEWKLCDADTAATVENVELGIAQGAGVDGGAIASGVLVRGLDSNQTGMTPGDIMYAGNTAGEIASSSGTTQVAVGIAYSATQLYFNPRFNQQLTEDQQDAIKNPTSGGSLSLSNPVVDSEDVSDSGESGKIIRADGVEIPAIGGSNITGVTIKKSFTAGEDIDGTTTPKAVVVTPEDTQELSGGGDSVSDAFGTDPSYFGQSFTTPNISFEGIQDITLHFTHGSGTTSTTLTCEIRPDNGSGKPHASTVLGSTTAVISGGIAEYDKTFTFSSPVELDANTTYHLVVYPSVTDSNTQYLAIYRNNTGSQGTTESTNGGTTFSDINGALEYEITVLENESGKVYLSNATNDDIIANNFIGFVSSNLSDGDSGVVTMGGVVGGFSGLTIGATYYLTDTYGAIGTSAGSQSRKIGKAVSATEILIMHDNT
jgi:hypothetical protein